MKKLLISLIAVLAMSVVASAADYTINDAAIDAAIENATEVSPVAVSAETMATAGTTVSAGNKDAVVLVLNFFLGGFGIHRHYMGTAPWMWAAYTFTFGGIFGVIPTIDFIFEIVGLVDGSGLGRYYGNTSFFMWA
ncbi:MAG: TM2 domain-containing protein [Bacteroidales bacterium]|nr:TM2 domain-containing protein [Bacteroidales bacterium]